MKSKDKKKPERPKFTKESYKTLKRLLAYVGRSYKWYMVVVIFCILISSISMTAVSLSLKFLLDDYIIPMIGSASPDFLPFYRALTVLGAIFLSGVVSTFFYRRIMVKISQGVLKDIRDDMFGHMQTLPIRYFDERSTGSIMSLYTNDTDSLRNMLNSSIPQIMMSSMTILVTFISMLSLSKILTALAVAMIIVNLTVSRYIGAHSGMYFRQQQEDLANITGFVEERLTGQKVVKVFNHEQISIDEFSELNQAMYESTTTANSYANMMGPVVGNLGNLQFVVTAVLGGILLVNGVGGMTIGVLASYLQFTKNFTQPFNQISQQFNSIVTALAGADRIFTMMDAESEKDDGYVELVNACLDEEGNLAPCENRTGRWAWRHPHKADGSVTYVPLEGDVRFFDLTFGYDEDEPVLHDISLFAKPGQKLAFVGATGAGKTTIINLITRFYDVDDGKIRYDGININKIKKKDLRLSLGLVLQDVQLFTGTIKDNIRYGKLTASDEDVVEAAKLAHADGFIRMLPKGYDTWITANGDGLSEGQKQLITIARAAIADPPVLILDEATSSIDTRTESIVQKGMDSLMQGRTTFVIAHRLSTIRNSDAIIVLDHGRIVERGDHEDLLEQKGIYYQLYTGDLEME